MMDVIEVFDGIKNVEFKEFKYLEEAGTDLPVFILKLETADEWNKKARIQNTKMYIQITKRIPKDYHEVLTWIYGRNEENQPTTNELVFA
jgi:hypothetical protein